MQTFCFNKFFIRRGNAEDSRLANLSFTTGHPNLRNVNDIVFANLPSSWLDLIASVERIYHHGMIGKVIMYSRIIITFTKTFTNIFFHLKSFPSPHNESQENMSHHSLHPDVDD
jgi:hypothetical protein